MKSLKHLITGAVLGTVVIIGVAATNQSEVQKWEYLRLPLFEDSRGNIIKVAKVDPPGSELEARPTVLSVAGVMNFYGNLGWELQDQWWDTHWKGREKRL